MIELLPHDNFEHAPDLSPYVPPKSSSADNAPASSYQRMFRVLSGVMSELEINENDIVTADPSPDAIANIASGSVVAVEAENPTTGERILLLRQFIGPYLLITNSQHQNYLSFHMLKTKVKIIGVVRR
jgi:hypothetical protein